MTLRGKTRAAVLWLWMVAACGGDPATDAPRPEVASPAPEALDLTRLLPEPVALWPVEHPHVTSFFGRRVDPVSGAPSIFHRGIDLRGATGDPVFAIAAGEVVFAGTDPVLGETVTLDHGDGLESVYAHLHARLAATGMWVERGAQIGLVGNTGRSVAPHLHLTVKRDGVAVDPLLVLGQ